MDEPSLVFCLSPQPDVLRGLADKPGFRGRGLLARFLYVLPKSFVGARTLAPCPIPEEVQAAYITLIIKILRMAKPDEGKHTITFSEAAHAEWKEFSLAIEFELRPGGRFEYMMDWAGKLPGAAARIAGLLHIAEYSHGHPHDHSISKSTMTACLDLMGVFAHHAIEAFSIMATNPEIEKAKKVMAWINQKDLKEFTLRDCHHALQQQFPRVSDLTPGIDVLAERNIIQTKQPEKREGRPSKMYEVSPLLDKGDH